VRYLKVTLFIGLFVSLAVLALYESGLLTRLDVALAAFLGRERPPLPRSDRWLQYALACALSFGTAWTTIDISRNSLKFIVAAGAFAEVIAATWILDFYGIFFSPFAGLIATALSFCVGIAYAQSEGGMRKRVVRALFGDRVSRRTFAALVNSDLPLNLHGERCEATVVVCEIFNHEELSDALPVADYVAMNNAFLRNAADFLVERGGYLDECDGESLRVVFGTPLPDSRHAITAAIAALALAERLDAVNRECHQVWSQMFDFRVGVNSGEMVVAAYGSRRLGNFSVAGEPVEFARRLCAANTIYGSRILIGAATFAQAESAIEVRPMELIQRTPDERSREEIYELLALRNALGDEELERRDLFWKGLVYYREQRWDEALTLFHSARTANGSDGPVEFYIRRVEQLRAGLPALDFTQAPM
jgi:class 3 adenylate cyclase